MSVFAVALAATSLTTVTLSRAGSAAALDPSTWSFSTETPNAVWSDGGTWAVGTDILIVINDGPGGPEFADTAEVQQHGPDPADVGWWIDTAPFEIEPGDTITVTDDGPDTKSLVVDALTLDPVDPSTDLLTGTGPVGATVEAHASDGAVDANRSVLVGGDGTWSADFTTGVAFDIRPDTWGSAAIRDLDGDSTQRNWQVQLPTLNADPQHDRVQGDWWRIGTTVTVEIDDPGNGVGVDWTDSAVVIAAPWDPRAGYVDFQPGGDGFDVDAGQMITMGDGTTSKTHTVAPLQIDTLDVDGDMVHGTATAGAPVNVWVSAEEEMRRDVTAAPDGTWTADFSIPDDGFDAHDLAEGDQVEAQETDTDGDTTHLSSQVPNPQIVVETPNQIWSGGEGWIAGRTATITVDDDHDLGNGTLYNTTEPIAAWGPEPWEVGWGVDTGAFAILPGHVVTVDDGVAVVRTLDVVGLDITDVSEAANTVTGTAPADAWVDASANDGVDDAQRRVQADGAGVFTADFGNPGTEDWEQTVIEVRPGVNGGVAVSEDDGDTTHRSWRVSQPSIGMEVTNNELWATDFPIGATLNFTVEDPATPESPDWADTMTVFETDHGQTEAGYRFWGDFDARAGQVLTVTDGVTTRVLEVSTLIVTDVDSDTDRYEGTVDSTHPYDSVTEVCAWARNPLDEFDQVTLCAIPDGAGDWVIDFSGLGDIVAGDHSSAWQFDADGDETHYSWSVPPWIYVVVGDDANPDFQDAIHLDQWDFPVTVTNGIDTEIVTDPDFDGQESVDFDVTPGETVTVTGDDGRVKDVYIEELEITTVTAWNDVPPSTVFGTTTPTFAGNVQVTATADYGWWTERWVPATGGTFSADFANPGNGWREQQLGAFGEGGPDDIYSGGEVRAHIWDSDNDQVQAVWHNSNPRIIIFRGNDRIEAIDFPLGEPLTIELDDPATPGIEFSHTGVVATNPDKPWETILVVELGEYTVPDEATVTAADESGTPLVTTEVIAFSIDLVDPDGDAISGTAAEGSEVLVEADGNWRYPVADATDTWVADFSQPGTQAGEENPVDIMPGSSGGATLLAEGGSATTFLWHLSNAEFWVDPGYGQVWGNGFAPNAAVTLTVDGTDQGSYPTQGDGSFGVSFDPAVVDIAHPSTVVVSDGETEKTHTVTALTLTDVDETADQVHGAAEAGSEVQVWVNDSNAMRNTIAAPDGSWTADFSVPGPGEDEHEVADIAPGSNGAASQCDDDGDCTHLGWNLVAPAVNVDPRNEGLWGEGWTPDATVTITIGGTEHSTLPTDDQGNFGHGWDPMGTDLADGDLVEVTDGETTKTHTVTPLAITGIDVDADEITGTATPDGGFDIWVHDSNAWRHVDVNGTGNWTVDFSVPGAGEGEQEIADIVLGSNGNSVECDDDGDCTWADWNVVQPAFSVRVDEGEVHAYGWDLGTDVTIEIDDPGNGAGVDYSDTQAPEPAPWDGEQTFVQFFPGSDGFDLATGQTVTMTNAAVTKVHVVTSVMVTEIDATADTVSGIASPDTYLRVDVYEGGFGHDLMSDGAGDWTADFSGGAEQGSFDLVPGIFGEVNEYDDDGDSTKQGWQVPADVVPKVIPGLATVVEGDADSTMVSVPVELSEPSALTVTVDWATIDFQAVGGADFESTGGTLTFEPGTTIVYAEIEVLGDTLDEDDEYIVFITANHVNADPGGFWGLGFGLIEDDDEPPEIVPGLTVAVEGNTGTSAMSIPIDLSTPSGKTITYQVNVGNFGTATRGEDFEVTTVETTFEPGDTSNVVRFDVIGDTVPEPLEMTVILVTHAENATIGGFHGIGAGLIVDNDFP